MFDKMKYVLVFENVVETTLAKNFMTKLRVKLDIQRI